LVANGQEIPVIDFSSSATRGKYKKIKKENIYANCVDKWKNAENMQMKARSKTTVHDVAKVLLCDIVGYFSLAGGIGSFCPDKRSENSGIAMRG